MADVLNGLPESAEIEAEAVARSVEAYRAGADFGDATIAEAARSRGAELSTFDRRAARMGGVRLLEAGALARGPEAAYETPQPEVAPSLERERPEKEHGSPASPERSMERLEPAAEARP